MQPCEKLYFFIRLVSIPVKPLKASSTEAEVCLELLSLSLVPGIIH